LRCAVIKKELFETTVLLDYSYLRPIRDMKVLLNASTIKGVKECSGISGIMTDYIEDVGF
jgi:hypothetical protein